METWGGNVVPSPVDDPEHPGSLGTAISDAVRDAGSRADTHYSLGSVLNHVLLHQTVIGQEAKVQLGPGRRGAARRCDRLLRRRLQPRRHQPRRSCPTKDVRLSPSSRRPARRSTAGRFEYDFGDTAGFTPLLPMYTLGHDFVPPSIHAGGLRYHGDAPIISALVRSGRMEAVAYPQSKTFEAAVTWARTQGTVPAPETGHAIRAVIDEALAAKEEGKEKVILFNYSGPRPCSTFRPTTPTSTAS